MGYNINFNRMKKAFVLCKALLNSVGKGGWHYALMITGVRGKSYK